VYIYIIFFDDTGKVIMKGKLLRIWKEAILATFSVDRDWETRKHGSA